MEKKRIVIVLLIVIMFATFATPATAFSWKEFFNELFDFGQDKVLFSPQPNLVLEFTFNSSNNTFFDSSLTGNDGNCTTTCPVFDSNYGLDGGVVFDGGESFDVQNDPSFDFGPTDPFTFETWVSIDEINLGSQVIFSKFWNDSTFVTPFVSYAMEYNQVDNQFRFIAGIPGGGTTYANTNGTLLQFERYYVVGVYNTTHLKIFLNGTLHDAVPLPNGVQQRGTFMRFGSDNRPLQFFWGKLDDFRIWDRAFSDQEVLDKYNGFIGESPVYSSVLENPPSPFLYNGSSTVHNFSITWYDADLDTVWIDHNFTGPSTIDIINSTTDVYSYNTTGLTVRYYSYMWCANDTLSQVNCTPRYTYTVANGIPNIATYLNGLQTNYTEVNPSNVNISFEGLPPTTTGQVNVFCIASSGTCPFVLQPNTNVPFSRVDFYDVGYYTLTWSFIPSDSNFQNRGGDLYINVTAIPVDNPPVVTLISPINGFNTTSTTVNFQCNATDDSSVTSIELYTDISGSWQQEGLASSGSSLDRNVNGIPPGTYNWNCLAYDDAIPSQSAFAVSNRTFTVIDNPPYYTNPVPVDPFYSTPFNPTVQSNVSIEWQDAETSIDTVWVNHTFYGSTQKSIINNSVANRYTFDIGILGVGVYTYEWYANDTRGNVNTTGIRAYGVNQIDPGILFELNGNNGDITIEEGESVDLFGEVTSGGDGQNIVRIYEYNSPLLDVLLSEGPSPINVTIVPNYTGSQNYLLQYPVTQNYTQQNEIHTVNVNPDTTPPSFYNLSPPTPLIVNYTQGQNYDFYSDWYDTNLDTIWIEHNFYGFAINESVSQFSGGPDGGTYLFSPGELGANPAPGYIYKWYANDTRGNVNSTGWRFLYVVPIKSKVNLTLDGTRNSISVETGSSVNIVASLEEGEANVQLLNNTGGVVDQGNSTASATIQFNTPGIYNYSAYHPSTQNYTLSIETFNITVSSNPAPSYSNQSVNPPSGGAYIQGQSYNFSIAWQDSDLNPVNPVWIEQNFNGSISNITVPAFSGNNYRYSVSNLFANPSGYTYSWYANDSIGQITKAGPYSYIIQKANRNVSLSVDGVQVVSNPFVILAGTHIANYSVNPFGAGDSSLLKGLTGVDLTGSPIINQPFTKSAGSYNISWLVIGGVGPIGQNYNDTAGAFTLQVNPTPELNKTITFDSSLNTFSIPLIMQDYSLVGVFGSNLNNVRAIYGYSPSTGWEYYYEGLPSTLTTLSPKKGYFVDAKTNFSINITGNITNSSGGIPTIPLELGWNLIGLHDVNNQPISDVLNSSYNYTSVWGFNRTNFNYTTLDNETDSFESGKSYWIYVPEGGQQYAPPKIPSIIELLKKILL